MSSMFSVAYDLLDKSGEVFSGYFVDELIINILNSQPKNFKIMKKYFILPLLLLTISFQVNLCAQSFEPLWNVSFTQKGDRSETEILHTDFYNNVFVNVNYQDSIFLPDTLFAHPSAGNIAHNAAIAKFDPDGNCLFALDLFTDSASFYWIDPAMTTDRDNNIYLACPFANWMSIQDSVIRDEETGPLVFHRRDLAIIKLSSDLNIEYIKLISGNTDDLCAGMYVGNDGYLYLNTTHTSWAYETDTVRYFGQDSVISSNTVLSSILKMDKTTGDLIWRESFYGDSYTNNQKNDSVAMDSDRYLNVDKRNFISVDGDRFVVYGRTRTNLIISNDTIMHPDPGQGFVKDRSFVLTFDSAGYTHTGKIFEWKMIMRDLVIDEKGQFYFSAAVRDTMIIGNDTLFYDENNPQTILTMFNENWESLWYIPFYGYVYFSLDAYEDTLYFACGMQGTVTIFDTTMVYAYPRTAFGQISPQGEISNFYIPYSSRSLQPENFMLDNCKQILFSANFEGTLKLENDTLHSYMGWIADGLLLKMQRHPPAQFSFGPDETVCDSTILNGPEGYAYYYWNNELSDKSWYSVTEPGTYTLSAADDYGCWQYDTITIDIQPGFTIDLGADTAIALHDTLTLTLPDIYEHYLWSTGDTSNAIRIIGGELGPGEWNIWVQVNHGVCSHSDSVQVTVVSSVFELENLDVKAFPNPVRDKLYIESKSGLQTVELINLTGEVVYRSILHSPFENHHCIEMGSLKKGIYLLKINSGETVAIGRIIKM
ncbi:MAG TPA: T9SS type A sorting domain-containing protein [Bacteroidales bacterium]|nr:T9SS type A sorting domain-containing protein [Bacteroidales bacterium]